MNIFNIERAFKWKKERGWDTMYWCVDFHDTIFDGRYASDQEYELAPGAEEVLRWLTMRSDMKLIAFTCSYAHDFDRVNDWLSTKGIRFDWLNKNPECGDTKLAEFSKKFYFNVLLDDKAGMESDKDWFLIRSELERIVEWNYDSLIMEKAMTGKISV